MRCAVKDLADDFKNIVEKIIGPCSVAHKEADSELEPASLTLVTSTDNRDTRKIISEFFTSYPVEGLYGWKVKRIKTKLEEAPRFYFCKYRPKFNLIINIIVEPAKEKPTAVKLKEKGRMGQEDDPSYPI